MSTIDDPRTGRGATVDDQYRLRTHAVVEGEELHAVEEGNGYNLNTNLINITGDATLFYLKNTGFKDIVMEGIFVGAFDGITYSDSPYLDIIRNPTGGDLITDATPITVNQNRLFTSANSLNADVFQGKVGGTLTGGNSLGLFQLNKTQRTAFTLLNFVLGRGSSIGVKLIANISSGSANFYFATAVYEKEDTTD